MRDALLATLSARLLITLRNGGSLARIGGDTFALLQTELEDVGSSSGLARRLLASLSLPLEVRGREIRASSSIGIALSLLIISSFASVIPI